MNAQTNAFIIRALACSLGWFNNVHTSHIVVFLPSSLNLITIINISQELFISQHRILSCDQFFFHNFVRCVVTQKKINWNLHEVIKYFAVTFSAQSYLFAIEIFLERLLKIKY